jgi:hypothetical protein
MILLESSMLDFDPFIGASVEVFGALRPTVEAGGIIMRVEQITSLSSGSMNSSSSLSTKSVEAPSSKAIQSSAAPLTTSSILPTPTSSSAKSSVVQSVSQTSIAAFSSAPAAGDPSRSARIAMMSKEDISAARWTQLYCSSHIGFCVPVHKNWWYISFGDKADTLWHVEINTEEFEALGTGLISIDLIGGDIASVARSDGEVRVSGGTVTGYRSWTQGRHFAITADAALEASVRYMTSVLRTQ